MSNEVNFLQTEDKAWTDYRRRFSEVYDNSNYLSPLQLRVMRASHNLLEKAYDERTHFGRVLEIGAGTGEHITSVRHTFDEYLLSDLESRTLEVAKNKLIGLHPGKLKFEEVAGNSLNYPDGAFDRVVATHVLEHIYQPHLAIKEWVRVIRSGGVLSILIPTDPGLAWRLGRHFGPRRNAIAQGFAYDYIMAREHVNSCNNLIAILRHYFPKSNEAWWPLPISSIDLNLFFAFHASITKLNQSLCSDI